MHAVMLFVFNLASRTVHTVWMWQYQYQKPW